MEEERLTYTYLLNFCLALIVNGQTEVKLFLHHRIAKDGFAV